MTDSPGGASPRSSLSDSMADVIFPTLNNLGESFMIVSEHPDSDSDGGLLRSASSSPTVSDGANTAGATTEVSALSDSLIAINLPPRTIRATTHHPDTLTASMTETTSPPSRTPQPAAAPPDPSLAAAEPKATPKISLVPTSFSTLSSSSSSSSSSSPAATVPGTTTSASHDVGLSSAPSASSPAPPASPSPSTPASAPDSASITHPSPPAPPADPARRPSSPVSSVAQPGIPPTLASGRASAPTTSTPTSRRPIPAGCFEARLAAALAGVASGAHWWSTEIFAVYAPEGFARCMDLTSWAPLHDELTARGIVRIAPESPSAPMTVDRPHLFRYSGPTHLRGCDFVFSLSTVAQLPTVRQTPRGVQWTLPDETRPLSEVFTPVAAAVRPIVQELSNNWSKYTRLNKAMRTQELKSVAEVSHSTQITSTTNSNSNSNSNSTAGNSVDSPIVWSSLASSPSTTTHSRPTASASPGASYMTHIQPEMLMDGGSELGPDSDIVVLKAMTGDLANELYDRSPPVNNLRQLAAVSSTKADIRKLTAIARAVLAGIAADNPSPASPGSSDCSGSSGASQTFTLDAPDVSAETSVAPNPESFVGQLAGLSAASIWALCRVLPAATVQALAVAPDYLLAKAREAHRDVQDLKPFRSIAQNIVSLRPRRPEPSAPPAEERVSSEPGLLVDSVRMEDVTPMSSISVLAAIDTQGVVFLACQEPPILTLAHLAGLPVWRRRAIAPTLPDIHVLSDTAAALLH